MSILLQALSMGLLATSMPTSLDNDLESSLGTAGLTTATARFDPGITRFFAQGEFRTPFYESCYENPWRIPFYSEMWKRQLEVNVGNPSATVSVAGRMIGRGTRRDLLGNPIEGAINIGIKLGALKSTLETMKQRKIIDGSVPDLANIPAQAQEAAAVLLQVIMQTIPYRRAALAGIPNYPDMYKRAQQNQIETADPEINRKDLDFYRSVDLNYMYAAGSDLVAAASHARSILQSIDPKTKFSLSIPTNWGTIELRGGANDSYSDKPYLLILDSGGDDVYLNAPSNRETNNWCSIVLDTSGNDKYVSDQALTNTQIRQFAGRNKPGPYGPGSALFGISILMDSGGSDLYRSHRPGLGSAFMGVAYLEDSTGDDVYDAYSGGEGYGNFGIGILDDWVGNDMYRIFTNGQGFGGVAGFGMLIDRVGEDRYVAEDETIDFPSPQSDKSNVSMAQGAASGRRADYVDGHSLSGGVGVLLDEVGNDQYSCGVFGQGVGYWEGTGLLWDEAGNDAYTGKWYVQGASAHFGIGLLDDGGGDDHLTATMNMAQGAGHDFGIGFCLNSSGTDVYKAPNLSLGAGNANGIGVFIDDIGDDSYESTGITLGKSAEATKGSLRERALTLGLFFDMSGRDTYPAAATWAKDSTRVANWTDRRQNSAESQVGIFYDR
ncbi:MAG: hypothetical protein JST40_01095 [Armatimonadetes bacterium]|nr:hypothetical protein [Armatimonadota bacterium]